MKSKPCVVLTCWRRASIMTWFSDGIYKGNNVRQFGTLFTSFYVWKLIWAHLFGCTYVRITSEIFILFITYRRKVACAKWRCKRVSFFNKCEPLKCCSSVANTLSKYTTMFDRSVCRIKNKIGSWLLCSKNALLLTDLVHLVAFWRLWILPDLQ